MHIFLFFPLWFSYVGRLLLLVIYVILDFCFWQVDLFFLFFRWFWLNFVFFFSGICFCIFKFFLYKVPFFFFLVLWLPLSFLLPQSAYNSKQMIMKQHLMKSKSCVYNFEFGSSWVMPLSSTPPPFYFYKAWLVSKEAMPC